MFSPPDLLRRARSALAILALLLGSAATAAEALDPANPTCPKAPNWGANTPMRLTPETRSGQRILLAEGMVDDNLLPRLQQALKKYDPQEIWLRSPGGNARVGNAAGKLIRTTGIPTRIPSGWACFSACNFLFMGGAVRSVDPGGLFIVHMFTHTNDRSRIERGVLLGTESTVGLIGDIEQDSALLASEDNDFLIRMGLSRALLTEVMYQQKAVGGGATRRCLTRDEVVKYNVANLP
jgi:hypothetical protein